MIKKSLSPMSGVKCKTQLYETKKAPHKRHQNAESQDKIDICLNCKKPASECKGSCFGKY